jgi:hypothetical protein
MVQATTIAQDSNETRARAAPSRHMAAMTMQPSAAMTAKEMRAMPEARAGSNQP